MSGAVLLGVIIGANAVVGILIGICGIAGFLLPMLYTGFLGMKVDLALTYSFAAFLVSGIIGFAGYYRQGNLDMALSLKLGAGSILGAAAGVWLQALIAPAQAKVILYLVVLLSGISILWRIKRESSAKAVPQEKASGLSEKTAPMVVLGAVTGCICSLSGAGGPVLVMPLLVSLGVPVRTAVGVALFDSVFIALPAVFGYFIRSRSQCQLLVFAAVIVSHGVGTFLGTGMAGRVPVKLLKTFVAGFSVCIALYMLFMA